MAGQLGMAAALRKILRPNHRRAWLRGFSKTTATQRSWGFIGLGRMGFPMAKNLRAKIPEEDVLYIQDVNNDALQRFTSTGLGKNVRIVSSPREVAENAETIVTALPEPKHVEAVYSAMLQPATIRESRTTNARLFIDTSTIDLTTSREAAKLAAKNEQGSFVDAPMSGGVVGATAGTLTFMIGAPKELVPRVEEVLLMMGRKVLHMGEQTAGLSGKLANNYLLALNNIATAEAMNMGLKWGLDPKALAGMINISTGKCWPSEVNNPVPGVIEGAPASRDYQGGFGVALANKDLKLAIQAAKQFHASTELGDAAAKMYAAAEQDEKCKGRDFSVMYRYVGGSA